MEDMFFLQYFGRILDPPYPTANKVVVRQVN